MTGVFASRYARSVTLCDEAGKRTVRAFLRPVNPKSPETPELTAAGVADGRHWLLLMEPTEISGRAEIIDGGARYALLRWERLESHIEGVLCREAGDA